MVNSKGQPITVKPESLAHSVHKDLGCVDCHAGAAKSGHTAKTASASCVTCHDDVAAKLSASAHAMLGDPKDSSTCISCHGMHDVVKPSTRGPQFCATCHSTEVKQYNQSIHGRAHARLNGDAPTCQSCHGSAHQVVASSDAKSPVNKANLPNTCGQCHSNPALAAKYMFEVAKPVEAYESSAHGRAIRQGNLNAASCNDCHGVHDILPSSDPHSKIWKQNVASTCGRCHQNIFEVYHGSIHGQAVAAGVLDAATCIDCHGEHRILAPGNPQSPVYLANVSQDTCSRCHGDTQLMARFSVPASRVPTYEDSYHGLASSSGVQTVANCASCHGVHNILASSDPRSTINPKNLPKTCGQCHPGAGQRFAIGQVHVAAGASEPPALAFIRQFYLLLIPVTIGLMLLHNGGDWIRKLIRSRFRTGAIPSASRAPAGLRMLPFERVQHALLALSFMTLVWTGFALKYPDQWWTRPLALLAQQHNTRSLIHRIAASVFIAVSVTHLISLIVSRKLRNHWKEMIPKVRDAREASSNFAYNLGLGKTPPPRSSHSYIEKAEYWAVIWGAVIMTATGVMLWANSLALRLLPKLWLDVATSIHFYEAVLAALAILVWHFYSIIFDPDVYPLNTAFLTGYIVKKDDPHSAGAGHEQAAREQAVAEPGMHQEAPGD